MKKIIFKPILTLLLLGFTQGLWAYTQTFTNTPSSTATGGTFAWTSTFTNTPSRTTTNTPTPTGGTATMTYTPSRTDTNTPTPTGGTLAATFTFSPTPSSTDTNTPASTGGTGVASVTFTPSLTNTCTNTIAPTKAATAPPTFTPVMISNSGCFVQSGDGGDTIISDSVNPSMVGFQGVVVAPIPWPAPCGGQWISDNVYGNSVPNTPTTIIFQRSFKVASALIAADQFSVNFGADDNVQFVITNSAHPAGVTFSPVCNSTTGACQSCESMPLGNVLTAAPDVNTLTVYLINTLTLWAPVGTGLGYTGINYEICASPLGATATATLTNTPTGIATNMPTSTLTNTATSTATSTATHTPTSTFTNTPVGSAATSTPTLTPASTATLAATHTPTPTFTASPTPRATCDPHPYPNPCHHAPVVFHVDGGPYDQVCLTVYTVSMRRVFHMTVPCGGQPSLDLVWALQDVANHVVANGLYYVVIETTCSSGTQRYTEKLLVLM